MIKFGKSSDSIKQLKEDFFSNNEDHLKKLNQQNNFYKKQPKRKFCKICGEVIDHKSFFVSHDIEYNECNNCGHLNGLYEDTIEFCEYIYGLGSGYAKNYNSIDHEAYQLRTEKIYRPKFNFLIEALKTYNIDYKKLSLFDYGAGPGYFINAAKSYGMKNVRGCEMSHDQISISENYIGKGIIKHIQEQDSNILIKDLNADILSLIGVLEHLRNPLDFLEVFNNNKSLKYLFISVPLLSTSVILESGVSSIMPRQLAGGHTHLFTEKSLSYLGKKFNLEKIGEWWFGTDIMDIYRMLAVSAKKTSGNTEVLKKWMDNFEGIIDKLQLVIDKEKMSSEVHMLFRKKK